MQGGTAAADAIQKHAQKRSASRTSTREYATKLPDIRRDVADGGALKRAIDADVLHQRRARRGRQRQLLPPEYFELAIKLELAKGTAK